MWTTNPSINNGYPNNSPPNNPLPPNYDASIISGAVKVVVGSGLQLGPGVTVGPGVQISNSLASGQIAAYFTPIGYTLQQAAALGGFKEFDWTQTVTYVPPPSPYVDINNNPLKAPFSDPAPGGYPDSERQNYPDGTKYPVNTSSPFYFDPLAPTSDPWSVLNAINGNTLIFGDQPFDPCLSGGKGCYVNGVLEFAPPGAELQFTTDLVGVNFDGSLGPILYQFAWESDYTCSATSSLKLCTGGTALLNTIAPFDLGPDGLGGVTLLSETDTLNSTPAPSSWVLMLSGLAVLGFILRGNRQIRRRHLLYTPYAM